MEVKCAEHHGAGGMSGFRAAFSSAEVRGVAYRDL